MFFVAICLPFYATRTNQNFASPLLFVAKSTVSCSPHHAIVVFVFSFQCCCCCLNHKQKHLNCALHWRKSNEKIIPQKMVYASKQITHKEYHRDAARVDVLFTIVFSPTPSHLYLTRYNSIWNDENISTDFFTLFCSNFPLPNHRLASYVLLLLTFCSESHPLPPFCAADKTVLSLRLWKKLTSGQKLPPLFI